MVTVCCLLCYTVLEGRYWASQLHICFFSLFFLLYSVMWPRKSFGNILLNT
uniref:Uncharacterized protein n=1 Tax=Arundo donax TaxID=35708 RepID=A0A0A8XSK5_ARUDO